MSLSGYPQKWHHAITGGTPPCHCAPNPGNKYRTNTQIYEYNCTEDIYDSTLPN